MSDVIVLSCIFAALALIWLIIYAPTNQSGQNDAKDDIKTTNRAVTRMEIDLKNLSLNTQEIKQDISEIKTILLELSKERAVSRYREQFK